MCAVPIRTRTYTDPVGTKRRRRVVWRFGAIALVVIAVLAGCARFIGGIFGVADIVVSGSAAVPKDRVIAVVRQYVDARSFGLLGASGALPLVNGQSLQKQLASEFSEAENIVVAKEYPHTLTVTLTERTPIGIWCVTRPKLLAQEGHGEQCRFFDRAGVLWGEALQSRGPLLLLVRDERETDERSVVIVGALVAIRDRLPELGVFLREAKLPDAAPGDLYLVTDQGYELVFDAFGDVADQLGTLEVFLTEKVGDIAFSPLYLDLRTPGRVYYK